MRLALLSDIHGNFIALDAVLADVKRERVEQIVCLSDVAFNGPQPREVNGKIHRPPFAEYAILRAEGGHFAVEFRRVPLDVGAVVRAARERNAACRITRPGMDQLNSKQNSRRSSTNA
jgi:hypothetical protein